jgi:pimeloyl-ACP methyl ester carboxylesterase
VTELRPYRLEVGDGEAVVGDELPGRAPGYLFLHGLGSARAGQKSETLLAHARAQGRAFVRYDLRGHGASCGKVGRSTVSELIDDAIRALERLGPATLVGASLGGVVAAHTAARRPDLVAGLALVAPAFGLMSGLRSRLDPRGRMWTREGHGFVVEERVLADAEALDEKGLPGRIAAPTFVAHGLADDVIPHRSSERFFDALAATRKDLWLVPGGDHRLAAEAPEMWRRLDALVGKA